MQANLRSPWWHASGRLGHSWIIDSTNRIGAPLSSIARASTFPVLLSPPLTFVPLLMAFATGLTLPHLARAQDLVPGGLGVSPIVPMGAAVAQGNGNDKRGVLLKPSPSGEPVDTRAEPRLDAGVAVTPSRAAQTASSPPLRLRLSPQLPEIIPKDERSTLSSFISGDRISGRPGSGDHGRRPRRAAARRHAHHGRSARVRPGERPGQGQRQRPRQPGRQCLPGAAVATQAGNARRIFPRSAL